jgi:hypothetical protein
MSTTPPEKKKNQHYVWRYYLKAWASNGLIDCLEGGRVRSCSLRKVASASEFYRLERLSTADLELLKRIVESMAPQVHQLNLGWIETFSVPLELANILEHHLRRTSEDIEFVDTFLANFEEDLHGHIENASVKHLDSLRNTDASFLASDTDAADFLHFLALQHFRTQEMEQSVVAAFAATDRDQLRRIWRVLRHILATNVARTIYLGRRHWSLVFLENKTTTTFLTGDQPTLNTRGAEALPGQQVEELELYYPVLPRLAVLVTPAAGLTGATRKVSTEDAHRYNHLIVDAAHRQVFADTREHLEAVRDGLYS